jgi:hypothetical protein
MGHLHKKEKNEMKGLEGLRYSSPMLYLLYLNLSSALIPDEKDVHSTPR